MGRTAGEEKEESKETIGFVVEDSKGDRGIQKPDNEITDITNGALHGIYGSLLSLQFVSEQLIFFHKRRDIHMNNSAAMLNQIVPSDYIFRIIIFDAF